MNIIFIISDKGFGFFKYAKFLAQKICNTFQKEPRKIYRVNLLTSALSEVIKMPNYFSHCIIYDIVLPLSSSVITYAAAILIPQRERALLWSTSFQTCHQEVTCEHNSK